jgi:erythromycin esterase
MRMDNIQSSRTFRIGSKSIVCSSSATALRIETEDLISELRLRLPELVAKSDEHRYLEAVHYATVARQLLNYHAVLARTSSKPGNRVIDLSAVSAFAK